MTFYYDFFDCLTKIGNLPETGMVRNVITLVEKNKK